MKLEIRPMKKLLPLLALLLLLPGCKQHVTQSKTTLPPANALPRGQELFLSNCASCHQGVGNPPGPNAVILDSDTLKSEADFTALLRHPRSGMMTAFTPDVLPEKDVKALYRYILATKSPSAAQ
jgi:mono/diheme cytochrome c family protein